jgi:hypothetical protein
MKNETLGSPYHKTLAGFSGCMSHISQNSKALQRNFPDDICQIFITRRTGAGTHLDSVENRTTVNGSECIWFYSFTETFLVTRQQTRITGCNRSLRNRYFSS